MATTPANLASSRVWLASLEPQHRPASLADLLGGLHQLLPLLDAMPDVVFFIKDPDARYVLVNATLARPEIALQCGYTDHSAFSRQFKALTGLSPSAYRARKARNLLGEATAHNPASCAAGS